MMRAWIVLLFALPACGGSAGRSPFDTPFTGVPDGGFASSDAGSSLPPEMELDVRFEPPAVGESVLYATNTGTGRVAVIHASDFAIETVRVGSSPLPAL